MATAIFVFALSTCLSLGQNATPAQTTRPEVASTAAASYRIAGRTVSAADGHPLQGATVMIVNTKTQQPVASTLAGEDGAFAFTDLPADKYSLEAVKTGYLASAYDQHEIFSTAIVTGAGLDTDTLLLRVIFRGRAASELTVAVRVTPSLGTPSYDQELPVPEDWSILVENETRLPEQPPPPTRQQQMAQQQQEGDDTATLPGAPVAGRS